MFSLSLIKVPLIMLKGIDILSLTLFTGVFLPKFPNVLWVKFKFISRPPRPFIIRHLMMWRCSMPQHLQLFIDAHGHAAFSPLSVPMYYSLHPGLLFYIFLPPLRTSHGKMAIFFPAFQAQFKYHFFWVSSKYPSLDYTPPTKCFHMTLYLAP